MSKFYEKSTCANYDLTIKTEHFGGSQVMLITKDTRAIGGGRRSKKFAAAVEIMSIYS